MFEVYSFKKEYSSLKNKINKSVLGVLKSNHYILGEQVEKFEKKFSNYIGSKYCVGVASGTDALTIAIISAGIKKGDEVITTNFTAFPTITGIINSGAKPIVVDVNEYDALINTNKISEKINSKTKAIVPVHLFGQACNMKEILKISKKFKLKIIEDCSQSHGATFGKKKTGIFGNCAAFSFYPTKILGCYGDGGAVVTNSKEIYERVKKLRNYGEKKKYVNEINGFNSRLDEIQAAILNTKINFLDKWFKKRNHLAKIYINNLNIVKPLKKNDYGDHAYHLFVCTTKKRKNLIKYLTNNGINTNIHYPFCINEQKAFLSQKKQVFFNSKNFSNSVISLPMHPWLSDKDIIKISNVINKFKYA